MLQHFTVAAKHRRVAIIYTRTNGEFMMRIGQCSRSRRPAPAGLVAKGVGFHRNPADNKMSNEQKVWPIRPTSEGGQYQPVYSSGALATQPGKVIPITLQIAKRPEHNPREIFTTITVPCLRKVPSDHRVASVDVHEILLPSRPRDGVTEGSAKALSKLLPAFLANTLHTRLGVTLIGLVHQYEGLNFTLITAGKAVSSGIAGAIVEALTHVEDCLLSALEGESGCDSCGDQTREENKIALKLTQTLILLDWITLDPSID